MQKEEEQGSDIEDNDDNKSGNESYICDVVHAVILGRSDKRKDRVEIQPEMLIEVSFLLSLHLLRNCSDYRSCPIFIGSYHDFAAIYHITWSPNWPSNTN